VVFGSHCVVAVQRCLSADRLLWGGISCPPIERGKLSARLIATRSPCSSFTSCRPLVKAPLQRGGHPRLPCDGRCRVWRRRIFGPNGMSMRRPKTLSAADRSGDHRAVPRSARAGGAIARVIPAFNGYADALTVCGADQWSFGYQAKATLPAGASLWCDLPICFRP